MIRDKVGVLKLALFTMAQYSQLMILSPDSMDRGSAKSASAVDVRYPGSTTNLHHQPAATKRRKFFSSFRKKFLHSKYKDKNSNIESLSSSQPNVYNSANMSTDEDDKSTTYCNPGDSSYIESKEDSFLCDLDGSPTRSRSQSGLISVETMDAEVDSGIAVTEMISSSQVRIKHCKK